MEEYQRMEIFSVKATGHFDDSEMFLRAGL